jgi:hypothetical protein
MANVNNFYIQLFRQYPQIASSVPCLVNEYEQSLLAIQKLKSDSKTGELEVEAMFGKLLFTPSGSKHFQNKLPVEIMNKLMAILFSYTNWNIISDWYVVSDYYTQKKERIRVSYENKQQKVTRVLKHSLSHTDMIYENVNPEQTSKAIWPLRNHIVRVNMKFEECLANTEEIVGFDSVKLSLRKYFLLASTSVPAVSYRFELIQFWMGNTVEEAEQKMKSQPPQCAFECEIINLPNDDSLSDTQKSMVFASLLLKMQDFLDIPEFTHCFEKNQMFYQKISTFKIV